MRLRHKKPLNPYKGQTNNDKNEFNDDDFKQQGSPHKKAANGSTDQIYKYARILTKFIKTINEDYNQYEQNKDQEIPTRPSHPSKQHRAYHQQKNTSNAFFRCQQIKQQKQITRLQYKRQCKEDKEEFKITSRRKETNHSMHTPKQNKNKNRENNLNNSLETNKNSILPKTPSQPPIKNEKDIKLPKNDPPPPPPEVVPPQNTQNLGFNLQNVKNGEVTPPNMGLNGSLQNYLNLPGLLNPNQILNLQMYGGLNPMQLGQLPMGFPPIERMIINGYMPMNMNMNMPMNLNMNMNLRMNPQLFIDQKSQVKIFTNLFSVQASIYNNKITDQEKKNNKYVYPLKRSAFHVAIAYKIYLDKLKKDGNNLQKLEDIDPTKNARKIKSNQNNKPKDGQKKKR